MELCCFANFRKYPIIGSRTNIQESTFPSYYIYMNMQMLRYYHEFGVLTFTKNWFSLFLFFVTPLFEFLLKNQRRRVGEDVQFCGMIDKSEVQQMFGVQYSSSRTRTILFMKGCCSNGARSLIGSTSPKVGAIHARTPPNQHQSLSTPPSLALTTIAAASWTTSMRRQTLHGAHHAAEVCFIFNKFSFV